MDKTLNPDTVIAKIVEATRDRFQRDAGRDGFVSLRELPFDLRADAADLLDTDPTFERALKREWAKIRVNGIPVQEVHIVVGNETMHRCMIIDHAVAY